MLKPGLVSITFRKLSPREIVRLVQEAGLEGIEWGGDVHVPPGERSVAAEVRRMTEDAGLKVASYGSYFRVGDDPLDDFGPVLETALELGAPTIRVWAGRKGSDVAGADDRARVAEHTRRIAEQASEHGITVSYEYHGNTLTDTPASAVALIEDVSHPNLFTYWQPATPLSVEERLKSLRAVLPYLSNVHAFHWQREPRARLALAAGEEEWRRYLDLVRTDGRQRWVMLEFVRNDDPEAFKADAQVLKSWLGLTSC